MTNWWVFIPGLLCIEAALVLLLVSGWRTWNLRAVYAAVVGLLLAGFTLMGSLA